MRQDTNVVKKVENSNVTEVIMDECNNPHTETLHTHCLTLRENEKNLVEKTKKYTNTMTLEQKLSKEKTIDNRSHKILTIKRKDCNDEIKHLYKGMNECDLQKFNIEYDILLRFIIFFFLFSICFLIYCFHCLYFMLIFNRNRQLINYFLINIDCL